MSKNKIYFISDLHLGLHPEQKSLEREKLIVKWLEEVKEQTSELYLLGDIFDFWHEYKHVVPRGNVRFLGKLSELADAGTKIHFFTGNHDIWSYGYFKSELGADIHYKPIVCELNGLKFYLGHGDGLGKNDFGYKLLKGIFTNKILQWLFSRLHPDFALWLGKTWSKKSRYAKGIVGEEFMGEEKELQIVFAKQQLKHTHYDFFIFGHRHIAWDINLGNKTRVINLGDWIYNNTYGELNGKVFSLKQYQGDGKDILRLSYNID